MTLSDYVTKFPLGILNGQPVPLTIDAGELTIGSAPEIRLPLCSLPAVAKPQHFLLPSGDKLQLVGINPPTQVLSACATCTLPTTSAKAFTDALVAAFPGVVTYWGGTYGGPGAGSWKNPKLYFNVQGAKGVRHISDLTGTVASLATSLQSMFGQSLPLTKSISKELGRCTGLTTKLHYVARPAAPSSPEVALVSDINGPAIVLQFLGRIY